LSATLLQASEFGRLFKSSPAAHGSFTPNGKFDGNRKALGAYRTEMGPVRDDHILKHLDGTEGVGAIPIIAPDICWFGAIDVDIHDKVVLEGIQKAVQRHHLPMVPFRSKSGGLHLYMFFSEPQNAGEVVDILSEFRRMLGLASSVEIFPKQRRIEGGALGNWINLPYYNHTNTTRVALGPNGIALSLDEAISVCKAKMTTVASIKEFMATLPVADGPPCMQTMRILGVTEMRNEFLFSYARYVKAKYPDEWEHELSQANETMDKPLPADELEATVVKSHRKKDYAYKCSADPLKKFCFKAICASREYGIGSQNVSELSYEDLVQVMTDPPYYEWMINGKVMRFYSESDLLKQDEFRKQCIRYLHIVPNKLKDAVWVKILNNAFQNIKINEVFSGNEISVGSEFKELLGEFLTNRVPAANRQQILIGRVYMDEETRQYMFKTKDLVHFLHVVKQFKMYSHAEIQTRLVDLGAVPLRIFIDSGNKAVRVWGMNVEKASHLGPAQLKDVEPIDFLEDIAGEF